MSIKIESFSELTDAQIAAIEALQSEVYAKDGLENTAWLSTEINFDRSMPCFFMGYENGVLVAFLTLFLPTREEGEVIAFTKAEHQGKGIFTALLKAACTVLLQYGVPAALFAVEPKSKCGMRYLEKFPDRAYVRTEYRMESAPRKGDLQPGLSVRPVTADRVEDYLEISLHEYGGDRDAALAVVHSAIRKAYLICAEDVPVGVFELADGEALTLCGVVVAEKYRKKGYGNAIVQAAMNFAAAEEKKLLLDVDSENPPALQLYRKFGFAPTFEVQYYRVPAQEILNL